MKMQIKRIDKSLPLPTYSNGRGITEGLAGFDFYARESVTIQPKEIKLIPSNTVIKLPDGYALLLLSRSHLPIQRGLTLANGAGVVDPYFCGENDEIMIQIYNMTNKEVTVEKGAQIAQGVVIKYERVEFDEVESMDTQGDNGYWAVRENKTTRSTET